MATTFTLGLLASYYYTANLTVTNPQGTSFAADRVLIDSTRNLLYLKNCGWSSGCIATEGTLSRCPVGWKQKVLDDYVAMSASNCLAFYDNMSVGSASAATAATLYAENGVKLANLTTFNVTQPGALSYNVTTTYEVNGLLGLAYPLTYESSVNGGGTAGTFYTEAVLPWLPVNSPASVLALDLNSANTSSSLTMGGYDEDTYKGSIQWSLTQPGPDAPNYHLFTAFDMGVCGARAMGTLSGNWLGVVDTMSPCLTVPAIVFESFRAWALNATTWCHMDLSKHYLCYVSSSVDPTSLPPITFRLSQSGKTLYLPLADLVLDDVDGKGRRPVCIIRGPVLSKDVHDYQSNPIVFGTLALRSLYTVLDLANNRVGMANKASTSSRWPSDAAINTGCAALPTCVGQQQYRAADNTCAAPACGDYLYQEHTEDGTRCRFNPRVQVAVTLLVVSLVLAEMLSHSWRWQAGKPKGPAGGSHHGRRGGGPGPSLVSYLCNGLLAGVGRGGELRRRRRSPGGGGVGVMGAE